MSEFYSSIFLNSSSVALIILMFMSCLLSFFFSVIVGGNYVENMKCMWDDIFGCECLSVCIKFSSINSDFSRVRARSRLYFDVKIVVVVWRIGCDFCCVFINLVYGVIL